MTTETRKDEQNKSESLTDAELHGVVGGASGSQGFLMDMISNIIKSIDDTQKNIVRNLRG
jgi:hypothetical protein